MAGSETSFNSYTFTYKWTINDLIMRIYDPSRLNSPTFSSPSGAIYKPATKWTFTLFREEQILEEPVSIFLSEPTPIDNQAISLELKCLASSPETTADPRANCSGGQYSTSAQVQQRDDDDLDLWVWCLL